MKNSNFFGRLLQICSILGLMLLATSGTNAQGLPGSPFYAPKIILDAIKLCDRAEFDLRFIGSIDLSIQGIRNDYNGEYHGISDDKDRTDKIHTHLCLRHLGVTVHEAALPGRGSAFSITVRGMNKEQCKKYLFRALDLVNSHEAFYINEASIPHKSSSNAYEAWKRANDLGRTHCVQSRNKVAMTLQ